MRSLCGLFVGGVCCAFFEERGNLSVVRGVFVVINHE
jgi:hypothetical protein